MLRRENMSLFALWLAALFLSSSTVAYAGELSEHLPEQVFNTVIVAKSAHEPFSDEEPYDRTDIIPAKSTQKPFEDKTSEKVEAVADAAINIDLDMTSISDETPAEPEIIEPEIIEPEFTEYISYDSNSVSIEDFKSRGVYYGPSGRETYYNLDMDWIIGRMRRRGYSEEEYPYHITPEGIRMLGDYIMVAADFETRPIGTILDTSFGKAIVCDTGAFVEDHPDGIDIAVTW